MTGLVWQRCSIGLKVAADGRCTGERAELSFPEAEAAAKAAGAPWRLPTARELGGLVDQDCGTPAIDRTIFQDVSDSTDEGAEEYWTSTPAGLDEMMYFIDFSFGHADIRSPGFRRYARLVRGGR